jgi:hypothetical protein
MLHVVRSAESSLRQSLTLLCLHCTNILYMQANIINDLLDFETLKGATTAPELTRIDIDAVVHSVVRMFTTSVRSKVTRTTDTIS